MREAYEPSWYRITLAEGQIEQRASEQRPEAGKEPEPAEGRRGASATRRTPLAAGMARRRSFSRRRPKEEEPAEPTAQRRAASRRRSPEEVPAAPPSAPEVQAERRRSHGVVKQP